MLAQTATATMETYSVTVSRLGIKDPDLVSVSPEQSNIYFTVHPRSSLKELLKKILRYLTRVSALHLRLITTQCDA